MNTLVELESSGLAFARVVEASDFASWYPYRVRYMLGMIRRSGRPYRLRLAASLAVDNRAGQLHRQLVTTTNNQEA